MDFISTVQAISWFVDRHREGSLEIAPPFQRKPVWTARQKCYLIESILETLPVPEVYMQQATSPDGRTAYAVVDGQQRIRAILQFVGSERDGAEQEWNKFSLDKLPPTSRWRNMAFDDLSEEQRKRFFGFKLAVRYLETESLEEVRDMFRRLNKFLTPLNPQELRNATYEGPFVKLTLALADDEYWSENRIVSPALIRRMGDVEFVSELLIGVMHGPQGGSPKVVDEYYERYEHFETEFPGQPQTKKLFSKTLGTIQDILPNIKGTRWGNRTDFYTLFVAFASLLRAGELRQGKAAQLRSKLAAFAQEADARLADEHAKVSQSVVQYVRAVEKGANDKVRRANRHSALLQVIEPYFKQGKSTTR